MEEIFSYHEKTVPSARLLHVYQLVDIVDSNMDLSLTRDTTEKQ